MTTENPDAIDNPTNEIAMLQEQYVNLMHAMQTGVEYLKEYEPNVVNSKHLRVGVNSQLVGLAALVKTLIDKGVIEEVEYWRELVTSTREEVERYEASLKDHVGAAVTLA